MIPSGNVPECFIRNLFTCFLEKHRILLKDQHQLLMEQKCNQPSISVLIPVWDDEIHIEQSISSVLTQDYPNVFVLISDNNSSDATPLIIKEICEDKTNVKIFTQPENIGSHNNFVFLSEQVETDYFMFLGSDDTIHTSYLSEMIAELNKSDEFVAVFPNAVYGPKEGRYHPGVTHDYRNVGLALRLIKYLFSVKDNGIFHALIRKEVLKETFATAYRLRVSDIGIDHCWMLWVLASGDVRYCATATVIRKYGRGSNFTRPYTNRFKQFLDIYQNSFSYFRNMRITLNELNARNLIPGNVYVIAVAIITTRMFIKRPIGVAGSIYLKQPIKRFLSRLL